MPICLHLSLVLICLGGFHIFFCFVGKELWVNVICFVLVFFFSLFDGGIMRKACKGYVAFQFSFWFGFLMLERVYIYEDMCYM